MIQTIAFFEDSSLKNFYPLTLTRPIYDLRVGILTLAEKWLSAFNQQIKPSGLQRSNLKELFKQTPPIDPGNGCYWINPRVFPFENLTQEIKQLPENTKLIKGDTLIAVHLTSELHNLWLDSEMNTTDLNKIVYAEPIKKLDNIWEIFQFNGEEINRDLEKIRDIKTADKNAYPNATLIDNFPIYIEEGAVLEPGVVLYADSGPIYIGKDVRIMANSVVRGPAAICDHSVIKTGAKIDKDTTIGPVCKVGGEVSNTVFHSYCNKAHDGFAGNSVFGQWCNLGADTNTSNLKNNYSTVRIRKWDTEETSDTQQQFLGTIMGDHSKTGINAMLNTGTLCGVSCNLFSTGYQPKFVPSFSWVGEEEVVPYHFEKAIEAMEKMMQRRDVELTPAYKKMMRSIFESSR